MTTRRFGTTLQLFICTICLACMHAWIGVFYQSTPTDVFSLLSVQQTADHQIDHRKSYIKGRHTLGNQQTREPVALEQHKQSNFQNFIRNVSYVSPLIPCNKYRNNVIVLVNSIRRNIERRKAIRNSWANSEVLSQHQVCLVFVIGVQDDVSLAAKIEQEKSSEQDILEGHFVDNIHNNSLKALTGLTWTLLTSAHDIPYVIMVQDNMFVNVDVLVNKVIVNLSNYPKSFWMGSLEVNRKVTKRPDSVNYVSDKIYTDRTLPPYCAKDAGFLLTSTAVEQILQVAKSASFISRIDLFLAVFLDKYNEGRMKIFNNNLFSKKNALACDIHNMVTSQGMVSEMSHVEFWRNVSSTSFLKTCDNPDLNVVLTYNVSNKQYFEETLQLIHANEHACEDIETDSDERHLVALISSLPGNYERRTAIRLTWGKFRKIDNVNIRILFVMGIPQENADLHKRIISTEMSEYNDIIQYNCIESFKNLSLKVVVGLKWMKRYCNHAHYFYKGDDDMFVNFKRIVHFLQQKVIPRPFYLGQVMRKSITVRRPTSKYYIPEKIYSGKFFPPYCSGGGYIISVDVIPAMYKASLETPLLPIDDAFQGILAKKVGVVPTMIEQFKNYGGPSDHCSLISSMTVHGFNTSFKLMEVWTNYTQVSYVCPLSDEII
ncbi:uncharacterized protein [Antedon mediterranea]|uniref:uncharacterized protein n=1 Tax=Antedon mediterranea TaxID=105859 RepID=UPI003AF9E7F3